MKRLFLSILPLLVGCALSAQTYHDGVWYSLYDDATHTMNTQGDYETGGVFAPTTGTLNVQWRYEWIDWLGAFAKIDTEVLTSADNGDNTTKVGKLAENTGKNSNTTESFSVGRNINWIKFNRTGLPTHKVHVYHIDIPLAKHILLASGDYGTATASYDFGEQDVLSTSEPYKVNLRSFLSAGDIKVTSSDPEIFHIGSAEATEPIVYAVGANACASANGTADAASGSALGKIANYAFSVYFTPKKGGSYTGEITLTDGVSTATITLSGTGRKLNQSITWNQEKTTFLSNETIVPATASSELEVAYSFNPEGIVTFADGVFSILSDGQVTVTAAQGGNEIYNAAESVSKTFTIFPAVSYNAYEASICEGEVYNDAYFGALTEGRIYSDTIPNAYGGDSVICLTLHVHPLFASEESFNHYLGLPGEWQGVDLSLLPLGDTTLVAAYSSAYGCDSTYTLHLSVLPNPTTYGEYKAAFCEGDSIEFAGKWYFAAAEDSVTMPEKNIYGGDSIVLLTVSMNPVYQTEQTDTMRIGEEVTWQGVDLSVLPIGDTTLVAAYSSVYGCDSVYILHLTVEKRPTTYGKDSIYICGRGEVAYYDNKEYTKPSKTPVTVTLSTPNQFGGDSIVELWVLASNKYNISFSKEIKEGTEEEWQGIDLSVLPAGDTTLVVIYTTVHGCDSTYTLNLTVKAKENTATALDNADAVDNKPYKFFRNGQMYIRKNGRVYNLQGIKVEEE